MSYGSHLIAHGPIQQPGQGLQIIPPNPIRPLQMQITRDNAVVPGYATDGAAAFDLHAAAALDPYDGLRAWPEDEVVIDAGNVHWFGTGLAAAVPQGYALDIIPRSGAGAKRGLVLANGTGLIDPDYRGEIIVVLFNRGHGPQVVKVGDRIAQARIVVCPRASIQVVSELPSTLRGAGGFGHTGG